MLGKLTRFELKKSLGNKFFLIALCLLLVVDILLNFGFKEFSQWMEAVKNDQVIGGIPENSTNFFGYNELIRTQSVDIAIQFCDEFVKLSPEEIAEFDALMKGKYGEEIFDDTSFPPPEAENSYSYFENITDAAAISNRQWMKSIDARIAESRASAVSAAKLFGREALEDGDNYNIRRNLKIVQLYSVPQPPSTYTPPAGWYEFTQETPYTIILVGLLLLLTCAGSVSGENDRQTWLFLHTSKNGRGKTLAAKYLAGIITAAGVTVLIRLASLFGVWFHCGLIGLSNPITIFSDFTLFPYVLTVWEYILVQLACQIFAAAVLSVLLTTVSTLCRSGIASYIVGTLLLGGCLLLVYFPPRQELFSGPLALAEPTKYFDSFYTANLFGYPVLWVLVQVVLGCILCAGCMLFAQFMYRRKRGAI